MSETAPREKFGALAARDLRNRYENLVYEMKQAQKRFDQDPMNPRWIYQLKQAQEAVDKCEKEVKSLAW